MNVLTNLRDRFFGRGAYAATLPPMDGVLRPNTALDAAPTLVEAACPDHLHTDREALWFTSDASVCRLDAAGLTTVATYAAPITAFARAGGQTALACADGLLELPFAAKGLPEAARRCITGLAFTADGACLITVGSNRNTATDWQKDLLEGEASGSLWRAAPDGTCRALASGLAWPQSPLALPDGSVLISESARHRLLRVDNGRSTPVIANLPGYPAGICQLGAGYALCLKAPRNQLIEFILREPDFVAQMIRTVPREYWIAPSLHPSRSFLEPLQGGALKQLGIMKPWAPSRSSGLAIELDADFLPIRSHHSRADGQSHGTVSVTVLGGALVVASQGAGRILKLEGVQP